MITVSPYLIFNGDCEEAFNFYLSVFGGKFETFSRYKNAPADMKVLPADEQKILHVFLRISKEVSLMGSDHISSEKTSNVSNNVSISIKATSESEATHLFNELSVGGKITHPLERVFWGALYGSFFDKFGIHWMVSFEDKGSYFF